MWISAYGRGVSIVLVLQCYSDVLRRSGEGQRFIPPKTTREGAFMVLLWWSLAASVTMIVHYLFTSVILATVCFVIILYTVYIILYIVQVFKIELLLDSNIS